MSRRHPAPNRWASFRAAAGALLLIAGNAVAQPAPAASVAGPPAAELIVTLRANGIERGEFTLLAQPDGDFWLQARDLARLNLEAAPDARRMAGGETYYSMRALGATELAYDEAQLAMSVVFGSSAIVGTRLDLSGLPAPLPPASPANSLILSYRLSTRTATHSERQTSLDNELNLRMGSLLLRQETRLQTGGPGARAVRGITQLVHDDVARGNRWIAGDVVSSAGGFGSTITGAGLMVSRVYDMRPDLVRQPTANLRADAVLPSEIELSVDGSTVYRTTVGPGPVLLDNILQYGGSRNLRLTITDASGRRQVIEQPFFFTDSALARGLHEFSYFAGRRSELGIDNRWHYREQAFQGYHRYGVTDHVTVGGGLEATGDFASGGAGLTLRHDDWGLFSFDALASRDRRTDTQARGWSGRYTYLGPDGSLTLGHRRFDEAFASFSTVALAARLRSETRAGFSTISGPVTWSFDWVRSALATEKRTTTSVRLSTNFSNALTLSGEVQSLQINGRREWGAVVSLRAYLDGRRWTAAGIRQEGSRSDLFVEAGQHVPQGEGFGYRVGANSFTGPGSDSGVVSAAGIWNLRPATVELSNTSQVRGGHGQFTEAAVSGSLVAVDGTWGFTRRVTDSFVLARLGVPQAGIPVLLNNQVQGTTDEEGKVFLPGLTAFGRQEVGVDDRQLPMLYHLAERRRVVAPAYRSGSVVDFGGRRIRAVAGMAWRVEGGRRLPVKSASWTLADPQRMLRVETGSAGDFYLEDAPPGVYSGPLEIEGRRYTCTMAVGPSDEVVQELKEGIVCE